ncbi:uncharacterized protein MKZ38_000284 [Zalerion maritima]|uniref:Zonadhesin n=1 Tax=Zalerion maritima TaxID=339359 RepID=A0AAD5WTT1_9PEZI|nr:uncharacterized protein MKZ38_000284 [Zalerion maritima]
MGDLELSRVNCQGRRELPRDVDRCPRQACRSQQFQAIGLKAPQELGSDDSGGQPSHQRRMMPPRSCSALLNTTVDRQVSRHAAPNRRYPGDPSTQTIPPEFHPDPSPVAPNLLSIPFSTPPSGRTSLLPRTSKKAQQKSSISNPVFGNKNRQRQPRMLHCSLRERVSDLPCCLGFTRTDWVPGSSDEARAKLEHCHYSASLLRKIKSGWYFTSPPTFLGSPPMSRLPSLSPSLGGVETAGSAFYWGLAYPRSTNYFSHHAPFFCIISSAHDRRLFKTQNRVDAKDSETDFNSMGAISVEKLEKEYLIVCRPRLEAYQYNPQAIDDHEDDQVREKKTRTNGRGNKATYRPTPLTWPFILVLILLIAVAIGLVIFVRQTKPDSDDDANIETRALVQNAYRVPRDFIHRQEDSGSIVPSADDEVLPSTSTTEAAPAVTYTPTTVPTTQTEPTESQPVTTPIPTSGDDGESEDRMITSEGDNARFVLTTSVSSSCDPESCVLVEEVISYYETEVTSITSIPTTFTHMTSSRPASSGGSSTRFSPTVVTSTKTSLHYVPVDTTTLHSTLSGAPEGGVITLTSSVPVTTSTKSFYPTIFPSYANSSRPVGSTPPPAEETSFSDIITVSTVLSSLSDVVTDITSTVISTSTEETVVVSTIYPSGDFEEQTPTYAASTAIYIETGKTTLFHTKTIENPNRNPDEVVQKTTVVESDKVVTNLVTHEGNTVVTQGPDEVATQVVNPDPTTIVTEAEGSVVVAVVETTIHGGNPITEVVESWIGGELTTIVQEQQPQTIVTMIDGVAQTVVTTPPAQTITSAVGGSVVSVPTGTSVNAAGETITLYGESTVGGSLTTYVTQPPPETLVQTIDGTLTTIVTTPGLQTLTTMIGGTLTTITKVSTPTADIVSTYTTSSSVSGSLTTIVSTPSPTSIITTISGKLTTLVSTPSVSTMVSTISGTSYTSEITATATSTGVPEDAIVVTASTVSGFTAAEYFAGKFLPAFYAVGISIILRIIDINAKLYQPFRALSDPAGAFGQDSLNLQYNGLMGFVTPVITLVQGHPIPFITTFTALLSSFLVPLSSEAIGIKLTGNCQITAIENCAGRLGVSPAIAFILVAMLSTIIILLLLLIFFLRKYNTGLYSNPWSIAGMASLAANPDIRINGADSASIKASLAEKRFGMGSFENSRGRDDYGIVLVDESGRQLTDGTDRDDSSDYGMDNGGETNLATGTKRHNVPFMALSWPWRLAFIFVLLTMFGLTLYYHLTSTKSNPFRDWIQGQSFGVRFLFAGVGVVVAMCFFSFFISVALISPYANMQHRSQLPDKSILLTRPTNAFFGIWTAIKRGDVFLILVAFMAIVTEFLPIILVNVPYSLTQTRTTHVVCTRLTMAILIADILVVFASLFRKWPHMPADPRNIAGAMYYVTESRMLRDFEGTSEMKRQERDTWLREKGRRYFYGETPGNTGGYRMAVEGDSVTGEGGLDKVKTEYRGYEGT